MKEKDRLIEDIKDMYMWYSIKSGHVKKKALRFSILSASLAAGTTVVLGLNIEGFDEIARITALILAGFLTVLNAWNAFFNHKEMWIEYRKTATKLKKLINKVVIQDIPLEDMVIDYHRILDEAESSELKIIKKEKTKNAT